MSIKKAKRIIERIGIDFQIYDPFYGSIFRRLKKIYDPGIRTIGLQFTERGLGLCINPKYIKRLSYTESKAICKHVILHVYYKHIITAGKLDEHDRVFYHISADLSVNQKIDNLPSSALSLKDVFCDDSISIETKKDAGYYYTHFSKSNKNINFQTLDNHDFWIDSSVTISSVRNSEDDSGKHQNLPVETDENEEEEYSSSPGADEVPDNFEEFPLDGSDDRQSTKEHDPFPGDDLIDDDSPFHEQDNEDLVDYLARKAEGESEGESAGILPGKSIREIYRDESGSELEEDWHKILGNYLNNMLYKVSLRHYELKRSRRRPNRKMGFPFPSITVDPLPKLNLAVCIDASGSINNRTFQEFMYEVNCLYDREIKISLIGFDSEVKDENIIIDYHPGLWQKAMNIGILFPGELSGGTDFVPAVEVALGMKPRPDCIVLFTDSFDNGNLAEPKIPLIFVLSDRRDDFYDWAQYVRMY